MTKLKKTAVIFLCAMIAVFITFSLIGCSENEEDKKYDVVTHFYGYVERI